LKDFGNNATSKLNYLKSHIRILKEECVSVQMVKYLQLPF